jgi:DNA-binding response OmpR family regulator
LPGKILIVDDEEGIRKSLRYILSKEGHVIFQAADGRQAVEILSSNAGLDVVLLDIKMPNMDGMEVLEWARENGVTASVVMLTGLMEVDTAVKTMKSGAFDYLTKPVRKGDLLGVVKKAVKSARETRARMREERDKIRYEEELKSAVKKQTDAIRSLLSLSDDRPTKRILLAKLDPELTSFLMEHLRDAGYEAEASDSFDDAVARSGSDGFDMVITALTRPDMTGLDLATALRSDEETRDIKTLMVIEQDFPPEDVTASKDAGVDDFLKKPIDVEELLFRVGMQLYHEASDEIFAAIREKGTFSGIDLGADLESFVSFLLNSRRRAVLEVESHDRRKGTIYFDRGDVVHARFGDLTGKEAFYRLMSFAGGSYTALPWKEPEERTIDEPGEFLYMEALRLKDSML